MTMEIMTQLDKMQFDCYLLFQLKNVVSFSIRISGNKIHSQW